MEDSNKEKADSDSKSYSLRHLIGFIAIAIVFFLCTFIVTWYISDWESRGQFGDMFGITNALFSGLAFAGLIYAILLQRQELKSQREDLALQREELKQNRIELEGQKLQLKAQKEQMEIQNFENRFFQLLSLLNDTTNGLEFPDRKYSGRQCFERCRSQLGDTYKVEFEKNHLNKEEIEIINSSYILIFRKFPAGFSNYMRVLYNIFKLIDRHDIPFVDKTFYANIVRAQLSQNELEIIFYNCLSKYGKVKFQPLIIKYAVMKHLDHEGLLNPKHSVGLYPDKAFGR